MIPKLVVSQYILMNKTKKSTSIPNGHENNKKQVTAYFSISEYCIMLVYYKIFYL